MKYQSLAVIFMIDEPNSHGQQVSMAKVHIWEEKWRIIQQAAKPVACYASLKLY